MSKRPDISQQIRKYLNGELDAHAMHQLEREALNDPFLTEALEGYEKAGGDQEQNLSDIHARLQDRITEKRRRIVLWRTISIAASVLIVLTIGGLWLKNERPEIQLKRVANITKTKPSVPVTDTLPVNDIAQQNKKPVLPVKHKKTTISEEYIAANSSIAQVDGGSPPPSAAEAKVDKPVKVSDVKKDSTLATEVVVIGYGTQKRKDLTGSVATIQPSQIKDKDTVAPQNALADRVAGVVITPNKVITGTVIGKDDSQPIAGVVVKIKGTTVVSQTDANGKFTLHNVPDKSTLDLSFIGYDRKEVQATYKMDSLVIAMQPNNNSLNEVVVVGYGKRNDDDERGRPQYQAARPAGGWKAYNQYLQNNNSPDGKEGTVKLSFIVNTDNSLSDFKIIKSVSAETDSAAIELVKNGTSWLRSNDQKPHKVRLRIKFTGK